MKVWKSPCGVPGTRAGPVPGGDGALKGKSGAVLQVPSTSRFVLRFDEFTLAPQPVGGPARGHEFAVNARETSHSAQTSNCLRTTANSCEAAVPR